jgi:hypothetical protein
VGEQTLPEQLMFAVDASEITMAAAEGTDPAQNPTKDTQSKRRNRIVDVP